MEIEEIFRQKLISVRAYNVCRRNKLHSWNQILTYYTERGNFINLHNCGKTSDEELIKLCNSFKPLSEELNGSKELNSEERAEILKKSFNNELDFLEIDNLLGLYTQHPSESLNLEQTVKDEGDFLEEILHPFQIVEINHFILSLYPLLTPRAKNALKIHLKNDLSVISFAENKLLNKKFQVQDLKNVGKKSIPEIKGFLKKIREEIKLTINNSSHECEPANNEFLEGALIKGKNKQLIKNTFHSKVVSFELLNSESIFEVIKYLIHYNILFSKSHSLTVTKSIKIFVNHKDYSNEEISQEVSLSRERVRQIKTKFLDKLFEKLSFLKFFQENLFEKYNIETENDFLMINDQQANLINNLNKTYFSKEFLNYILYTHLSTHFSLIGNVYDILTFKNSRNRHNWNNFLLVKKEITDMFNFEAMVEDISDRLDQRIEETYQFNFKSYLSHFLLIDDFQILNKLYPICEALIAEEFNLFIDLEENINFKKNTLKPAFEYAFEALEELGKPSKVEVIYKKVKEQHPSYITTPQKLRSSLKRQNGFVPIGRTSVFGLKKWEKEKKDFKGGTIRSIAVEYLEKKDLPEHISTLTQYITTYRPKTNEKSVLTYLKIDESGIFVFLKNSHIGLSHKNYPGYAKVSSGYNKQEKVSWEERFESLTIFIKDHNRFPYSSNCPLDEEVLYRWFNVQMVKLRKNKLNSDQTAKMTIIVKKFQPNRRRRFSKEKYIELKDFISQKKRLPSSTKDGEKILYQFFYNQKKLNLTQKNSEDEKINFIETNELIEKLTNGSK